MNKQQVDDAAFAIVLHRYIVSRAMHGETVTEVTAAQVFDIALRLGMEPACDLSVLGFRLASGGALHPLLPNRLQTALATVRQGAGLGWIAHLAQYVDGRSVEDMERGREVPVVRPRRR